MRAFYNNVCLNHDSNTSNPFVAIKFTNENGDTTHGIAITICEEVSVGSDDMGEIMDHLLNLRKRRICARKICRWWKRSVRNRRASMTGQSHGRFSRRSICLEEDVSSRPGNMKRRKSWNAITCIFNSSSSISAMSGMFDDDDSSDESSQCSKNSEKIQGKRNLKSSFNSKTTKETSGSFTSRSVSRSVAGLLNRKRLDRSNTDPRGRSSSKPIVDVPDTNSDGNSVESGFLDWNGLTHFSDEEEDSVLDVDFPNREEETKPKKAKVLAREAFRAMNAASAEGDLCVVEKCYVMIGGKQSEQFLHLRLLQNMIDKEQEVSFQNVETGYFIMKQI